MSQTSEASTAAQTWARDQFQKALKLLARNGVLPEKVAVTESRILEPVVAIWKIVTVLPERQAFWVLSGELPTDFVDESAAPSAREALRFFSMRWQLKAQQLLTAPAADAAQRDYAALLIDRAEGLYKLFDDNRYWSRESPA